MRALTTHLTWTPREAVVAKNAVSAIAEHPGLEAITEALEMRKLELVSQLLTREPSDKGADYERVLGQIRGLEELPLLINGIIEHGKRQEQVLTREEEGSVY